MLTKGDDYPIHQTPEPIAFAGSDRNFYDRYFFNAYAPDGSAFLAVAYGVYPALNVADAHIAIVKNGKETCLHASRILGMERMDLFVGPIALDILEPLKRTKVTVTKTDGVAGEIIFEGRAFPIEEPRFVRRNGPRLFMDYTRMTQNARISGWVEVDGERIDLSGWVGTRDRSWGIRPVGAPDPQPTPGGATFAQFFWQWTPLNFQDRSVYFHVNADADGKPWNTRAVILEDGAGPEGGFHSEAATMATELIPGTRHAKSAVLTIPMEQGAATVKIEPLGTTFLMRGVGYGGGWRHGDLKGELAVAREDIDCETFDRNDMGNLHIQAISKTTLSVPGQPDQVGVGAFEQLVLGPYRPLGL